MSYGPKLGLVLTICPYTIENWTETFTSGFGKNAKTLTTKATKMKSISADYWSKNRNEDEVLRKELELN